MVDDPAARRQALARKFGKLAPVMTPPTIVIEENVTEQAARRTAAVKDLHQRYKHRQGAIREQRVERFARAAEEALAAGNTVSALNTLTACTSPRRQASASGRASAEGRTRR